jgi:hypothetical protein
MTVHRLAPPTTAATFRALARDAHRAAVLCRLSCDEAGYAAKWRDVMAFDEQANAARLREERLRVQLEERRRMATALDLLLQKAGR